MYNAGSLMVHASIGLIMMSLLISLEDFIFYAK